MTGKRNNHRETGFGTAVLWVLLTGTLAVLVILTLVLLTRNGTFAGIRQRLIALKQSWQETKENPETGEERTHFGPSDGRTYDFWELFSWVPKQSETEDRPEETEKGTRELSQSPVNGSETWWRSMTKLTEAVTVYAQADTPLFGAPDAKTEVFGYTSAGEEFRLVAVSEDGWYVLTDGSYSFCSEGKRYTMTMTEPLELEQYADRGPVSHEVSLILQNPELPHGCEVTALAMLLSFYDVAADKCELAQRWLPKGEWGRTDFRKAFVGNPESKYRSAGCYAAVIADTASRYLAAQKTERRVYVSEGVGFSELLELLDEAPVLVWTTMELKPCYIAQVWQVDGEELLWLNCEHSVVLTGYDMEKGVFYGQDPLYGSCEYEMQLFYLRFAGMFSQAVWLR